MSTGNDLALAPAPSPALAGLVQRTERTLENAVPANTARAYAGDLRRFAEWCNSTGVPAMPAAPGTIAVYMQYLADSGRKYSTIVRAVGAICASHTRAGHPSPWTHARVSDMRAALAKELGVRPRKKTAADDDVLRRMLAVLPDGLLGLRDRALLTLGWCGAFRRSELVALDVADVTKAPKGCVVLVRQSKTDQERAGEEVPIFYSNAVGCCPVRSLEAWLATAGITEGAVFRRLGRGQQLDARLAPAAVWNRVRRWATVAGLNPDDFGAHSLRSGFMSTAARHGKDLDAIMRTSRHKSERVARGYIQRETLHERGAGEGLL